MTTNDPAAAAPAAASTDGPAADARAADVSETGSAGTGAIVLVISTFESREQAEPIARALVEERLAACANLLPGCLSIYRWQGAIERADEALMLVKTTRDRYPALERRLHELHPYELPEIVAVAPDRVLAAYADWVAGETRPIGSDRDSRPAEHS